MIGSVFAYYAAQDGQNGVLSPLLIGQNLPRLDFELEELQMRIAEGETIPVFRDRYQTVDPRSFFDFLRLELADTAEGKAVEAALRDTLMSTIPRDAGARYGYPGWTDHLFTGPESGDAIAEIRHQFHNLYPALPNWLDSTFKTARRGIIAMLTVLVGLCSLSAIIAWTTARRRFGVLAGMIFGMSVLSAGLALLQTQHAVQNFQRLLPEAQKFVRSSVLEGYLQSIQARDDISISAQLNSLPLDVPAELANVVRNPKGHSAYNGDPLGGRVTSDAKWSHSMEARDIAAIQTFVSEHNDYQIDQIYFAQARNRETLQRIGILLGLANVLLAVSLMLAGVAALVRRTQSESVDPLQS